MLARSTADISAHFPRAWVSAAVAATCCFGPASGHAERDAFRRHRVDPPSFTTSTSGRLFDGSGEITAFADGNSFVYWNGSQVEPTHIVRETSEQEKTIALLRGWKQYQQNWDGEGAAPPNPSSLEQASKFVCALQNSAVVPEAMLHHNGRAGLFWSEDGLYADLEFLEHSLIAYYIERKGDRHKGTVHFDGLNVPDIFSALLSA